MLNTPRFSPVPTWFSLFYCSRGQLAQRADNTPWWQERKEEGDGAVPMLTTKAAAVPPAEAAVAMWW